MAALFLEEMAAIDLEDVKGEEDTDWLCACEVASADGLNCEYLAVDLSRGGNWETFVIFLLIAGNNNLLGKIAILGSWICAV